MNNISLPQHELESILFRIEQLENRVPSHIFTGNDVQTLRVQRPLNDETFGQLFDDNDSSYPSGWTESDAAPTTDTNRFGKNWTIFANSSNNTFDYRKQLSITSTEYPTILNGLFTGIGLRSAFFSAAISYQFRISADNSGSPSTNDYIEVEFQYDTSTDLWKVKGSTRSGGTLSSGAFYTLPLTSPETLHVRLYMNKILGGASTTYRAYIGYNHAAQTQMQLRTQSVTGVNFENPWMSIIGNHNSSSDTSILSVGGIDFIGTEQT